MIHERLLTIDKEQFDEQDTGNIIAAGPLTCQPGSTPYRYIIHTLNGKLVVHRQFWNSAIWVDGKPKLVGKHGFTDGSWFSLAQLELAVLRWSQRIVDTNDCLGSVYRPLSEHELRNEDKDTES